MVLVGFILVTNFALAGLGINTYQSSIAVSEGEEKCITYGVYNPFPGEDTLVEISVSDELKEILKSQGSEKILIPANTLHDDSLPIEFCFKVPNNLFEKECAIGNVLCKQTCPVEKQEYIGEVLVQTVPSDAVSGSATKTTVSSDLTVRVICKVSRTNFAIIYALVALISAGITAYLVNQKKNAKKKSSKKKVTQKPTKKK